MFTPLGSKNKIRKPLTDTQCHSAREAIIAFDLQYEYIAALAVLDGLADIPLEIGGGSDMIQNVHIVVTCFVLDFLVVMVSDWTQQAVSLRY
jgi:hypothetical protein